MKLTLCIMGLLIALTGCNLAPLPPAPKPAKVEPQMSCGWTEVLSSRLYVTPGPLLRAGMVSVKYDEIHLWVEVEAKMLEGGLIGEVCELHPNKRSEGAGSCTTDRVGSATVLDAFRSTVKNELVKMGALPEAYGYGEEVDDHRKWNRAIREGLRYQFNNEPVEFCRVRLIVRLHKIRTEGDLQWWDEEVFTYPEGDGACTPGLPAMCAE